MNIERKRWLTTTWTFKMSDIDKQMLAEVAEASHMNASEFIRNAIRERHAQVVTKKPEVD